MAIFFKAIRNTVKHWYIPAIIGVLLVLLGGYLFTVPEATYMTLVTLFSISFLTIGILEVYFSYHNRNELEGWGWYLASGLFTTVLGVVLLTRPSLAAVTLAFFIGFGLLFRSFQGVGFAFELKNYGISKWKNLLFVSILGVVFSVILIVNPVILGVSIAVLTAFSFLFAGITGIILAFQLKRLKSLAAKIDEEMKGRIEDLREAYYEILED